MNSIFISINIPSVGNSFDFKISKSTTIQTIIHLAIGIINEQYEIPLILTNYKLVSLRLKRILEEGKNAVQNGLIDNERLILI